METTILDSTYYKGRYTRRVLNAEIMPIFFLHPMPEAQVSFLQRNKSPFPQKLTSPSP